MDYSFEGNVELLSEESVNSDSSSRTDLSQIDFPSVAVNADSFSRDIHNSVAQLYIVMLGRAPENAGLNIWSGELANGADIQDVCGYFAACSEVSDAIRGMTSAQQVNLFYLNAFDRSADSEGLEYWSGLIDDGIPFYEVARMLTEAAFNGSGGVDAADTAAIRSKVERATNFALHSQSDDIDSARDAVRPSTPDVGAPVQTDPAPQLPVNVTPGPSDSGPVTPEPAPVPALTYSSGTFVESTANNGTIGSSIVITLAGDTFSTNVANKILVSNVPEGLVASFALASNTILTATLTGTASPSASVHDINNLSFTFLDGAFEATSDASTVVNYTKTSLVVDFIDGTSTDEGGGLSLIHI